MGKKLDKEKGFTRFYRLHSETLKLVLLIGVVVILGFLNFNKEITAFLGSQSKQDTAIEPFTYPVQTQVEDTPTIIQVPTATPTNIPIPTAIPNAACKIGSISIDVPQSVCDKAKTIQYTRGQDAEKVQNIINNLNGQIQKLSNSIEGYSEQLDPNKIQQSCILPTPTPDPACLGPFPSPYTQEFYMNTQAVLCHALQIPVVPNTITNCMQSLTDGINNQISFVQNQLSPLVDQRNWYQNYLNEIKHGVGNGACSNHQGVSCSSGRGNIGQVVCNDGWRESQVYYFNVKECLNYFLLEN